ncbi:MAG: hypothetical protein GX811_09440 [Lentisphaerae bacterium]|jgi:hypothetical protein|nr:hypothetical protein [Lentisphaerota bacterium]
MHKSKIEGWICGLAQWKSQYRINNVNFIVESRFEPVDSDTTINERFRRTITSDFIPLTGISEPCKIAEEYVCSAAGKEN